MERHEEKETRMVASPVSEQQKRKWNAYMINITELFPGELTPWSAVSEGELHKRK